MNKVKKDKIMKVSEEVLNDLKCIGNKHETYDDVIRRLIILYNIYGKDVHIKNK